ncbi:ribosomal protein S3 (plastid) [Cryptomonas paramecium]|uniref:Small ribosomal subunit protein uS3c n=1 Tax=Cryptomonas paramaecium TaxID=2898 RepID=D2ISA0_9CRYP|nr:ribosomal protein S3 [Cryptomonas paramecium]ACT46792.1 ribosomal protein S3 [Cryptomonas paramecium]BDA98003.1 ribosomal protein S3 [Cryptomonas paramecium]
MGQKVHPLGFRLGVVYRHRSSWVADKGNYPSYLKEDFLLRKYFSSRFLDAGISTIEIHRRLTYIDLYLYASRPNALMANSQAAIKEIKEYLRNLGANDACFRVHVLALLHPDLDAYLLATFISQQLEKRISFRKVMQQAIRRARKAGAKGIKVQISGRLGGAEISRSEWKREGRVPLQTLYADINYAAKEAHTNYGVLGVKVWIFRREFTVAPIFGS